MSMANDQLPLWPTGNILMYHAENSALHKGRSAVIFLL